jgi:two-component system chemotaxis response regulator CheB
MLVDDSAIVRGMISRTLEEDPYITVVSSVHNGEAAVNAIGKVMPEVVLLDIEMPVMDGLTALPKLLQNCPSSKIIMCSTLTEKGASVSMKALQLGATEYICKPSSTRDTNTVTDFQKSLISLIKNITGGERSRNPKAASVPAEQQKSVTAPAPLPRALDKSFTLRSESLGWQGKPSIVAIGSSTGGPKALFSVLSNFKNFDVPIAVTQHMPATFTKILAQHIEQQTGVPCIEGETGMKFEAGKIYVAPGGYHMLFEQKEHSVQIKLGETPPENFCKPSVDPMMRSLIEIYGKKILGVILTGMGADGLKGCQQLVDAGGTLIAQDEATSIVWGMPGAVATNGLCTAVLPLEQIGPWVRRRVVSG